MKDPNYYAIIQTPLNHFYILSVHKKNIHLGEVHTLIQKSALASGSKLHGIWGRRDYALENLNLIKHAYSNNKN